MVYFLARICRLCVIPPPSFRSRSDDTREVPIVSQKIRDLKYLAIPFIQLYLLFSSKSQKNWIKIISAVQPTLAFSQVHAHTLYVLKLEAYLPQDHKIN